MARPTSIDDACILEAARAVFVERGIAATTAEVALRAGVSEGSVFRRFRTKQELFRAAMARGIPEPPWLATLHERVGQGEMRAQLERLSLEAIEHLRIVVPLVMLSWSNPAPNGLPCELAEPNPPPLRVLRQLSAYFEAEMRRGRVRRQDPEIVARTFMGATWSYVQMELVFRAQAILPLPAETFVRGLVELLHGGLDPREPDRSSGGER